MKETLYKRMLDKNTIPTKTDIENFIDSESVKLLSIFEKQLEKYYTLTKELKFPFGNNYGWGYKYSHKSTHLCYVFFEKNAFTVSLQLGDKYVEAIEIILSMCTTKTREIWKNRYPCGKNGGWINYRILKNNEIADIMSLVNIKVKPKIKNEIKT